MGSVYERRLLNIQVQLSNFFQRHKILLFLSSCFIFVFESHCPQFRKERVFYCFWIYWECFSFKILPINLKKNLEKQFIFFVQQFIGFLLFFKKNLLLSEFFVLFGVIWRKNGHDSTSPLLSISWEKS